MDDDIKGAMIDLKLPKRKSGKSMIEPMYSQEEYPWGLRITFETDQVDKMPELKTAEAGEPVKLMGMGKVINVRMSDGVGNKTHQVEIQLHKVAVKCMGDKKEEKPKGKMSKGKHGQMSYEMED